MTTGDEVLTPRAYDPTVTWVAAIWEPDRSALESLGDVDVRYALDDQGRYAAGHPFGAFVRGVVPVEAGALAALGGLVWAWRVQEHDRRVAVSPCPVTMVALMRRRPDLDRAAFVEHWLTLHAPLALRHHAGLADYRQCVVAEPLLAGGEEVDGVALLGFAGRDDLETRFYDSDEGRRVIGDDVRRFMAGPGVDTTLLGPPEACPAPG